jgi:hypothetical protein
MTALADLTAATRDAYHALGRGDDATAVYAGLERIYTTYGLDANVAESSIDWIEGGTLVEDLLHELDRLSIADDDEPAEPCDCADFASCSSCREWAENMIADGCSPWDGLPVRPGETVAPLPPWH